MDLAAHQGSPENLASHLSAIATSLDGYRVTCERLEAKVQELESRLKPSLVQDTTAGQRETRNHSTLASTIVSYHRQSYE